MRHYKIKDCGTLNLCMFQVVGGIEKGIRCASTFDSVSKVFLFCVQSLIDDNLGRV